MIWSMTNRPNSINSITVKEVRKKDQRIHKKVKREKGSLETSSLSRTERGPGKNC
jgi:hypothetical protein